MTFWVLAPALVGYLFGSIPFGLILTRAAGLGDVRKIGSGNIGATNVLRTGNKGLAALTLVFDALKGTAAVLVAPMVARMVMGSAEPSTIGEVVNLSVAASAMLAAAYGAFFGHCFPVWLGFKGGKGVATYIGVLLGVYWPAAVAFCGIWLLLAFIFRISSLSALLACLIAPCVVMALGHVQLGIALVPLSLLLIWRHRANIHRLLRGEEPRIGAKA